MKQFDIELASEFLLMAANLMYIKSQMMLPRPKIENVEEAEDPRTQLLERLLKYRQFKEGARDLEEDYQTQKYTYYRNLFDADVNIAGGESYKNTNLFDLIKAFKKVLEKAPEEIQHSVVMPAVSMEDKINEIIDILLKNKKLSFYEFVRSSSRINIVVTFLAILNLLKERRIFIKQKENFKDITIFPY